MLQWRPPLLELEKPRRAPAEVLRRSSKRRAETTSKDGDPAKKDDKGKDGANEKKPDDKKSAEKKPAEKK